MEVCPENENMQITFSWHTDLHNSAEGAEDMVANRARQRIGCLKFLQRKAGVPLPLDVSRDLSLSQMLNLREPALP